MQAGNLVIKQGDGRLGVAELGPYDAIHVGAAAPILPSALVQQLKPVPYLTTRLPPSMPIRARHFDLHRARREQVVGTWAVPCLLAHSPAFLFIHPLFRLIRMNVCARTLRDNGAHQCTHQAEFLNECCHHVHPCTHARPPSHQPT